MHFGMWRILLSGEHQVGFLWYRQMAKGVLEMNERTGSKGGGTGGVASTQPRMRLDFPPGGFLRPDGSPAAASSVGGASSGGSGTAAGSLTLFSKRRQTEG